MSEEVRMIPLVPDVDLVISPAEVIEPTVADGVVGEPVKAGHRVRIGDGGRLYRTDEDHDGVILTDAAAGEQVKYVISQSDVAFVEPDYPSLGVTG